MNEGVRNKIIESGLLFNWLYENRTGLKYGSGNKIGISMTCYDMAVEHHEAIVALMYRNIVGSSLALLRSEHEAYIRGLWFYKCANNDEIELFFKEDRINTNLRNMCDQVRKADGEDTILLEHVNPTLWKSLSSFVHTGKLQILRRVSPGGIRPNYTSDDILELLLHANYIGLLSALEMAIISRNKKFENQLYEKINNLKK